MEIFLVKLVGDDLVYVFQKKPMLRCKQVLDAMGLINHELLVEEYDYAVSPEEFLDFIEDGQVLFARHLR